MEFAFISNNDLITETEFYAWLKKEYKAGEDISHFIATIKRYTGQEKPFKGRADAFAHQAVYRIFWSHILKHNKTYQNRESLLRELKTLVVKEHNGVKLTKIESKRYLELVETMHKAKVVIPFGIEI
tara:strand:- start:773 stop:1153 length:381 start_codon:yes stop_codon:yes gene_type:complete